MKSLTLPVALIATLLSGAIFGFFYAWVCSTMWGLDEADPRTAIAAMQAMNASVRNFAFAPAFFGTPLALGLAALAIWRSAERGALAFALAALVYGVLGMGLTMVVNVPMNEALALVAIPEDIDAAREIWLDYSPRWQVWNLTRTITSGAALLLALIGLVQYARGSR